MQGQKKKTNENKTHCFASNGETCFVFPFVLIVPTHTAAAKYCSIDLDRLRQEEKSLHPQHVPAARYQSVPKT